MKVLLLGPQGSGKGTVGDIVSKRLGIPAISSGQLLREIPPSHPRFEEINDLMGKGVLVSQDLVASLIEERVSREDCAKGYILDGWGRAMIDLKYFDPGYDKVIVLVLSREECVRRITGRRICDSDGKTYNIYTLPPEEVAKCKGNLIQRADDTEESVNKRLEIYYSDTMKVVDHFRALGKVFEVDAGGSPAEVAELVIKVLQD
ncbi:nucleoside monophosphate kinase [Candidatus Nomurabacteria bacterium]|uniref:Adenylate kinase n=1 Tax=candidate division WWE3 bacterium TaxID=2053526 RepID=A0A955E0T2_UNCKA|nr:nucleoside monophosphate kinase [candidate division WWE3 bacterium]MCB9823763.1 nucleoside monophosphate kinase [Candidatus Nomurabacteria bacterium]MCB9826831.1 nucleoside monophosphate kinase [Candidatus Nomurabacteria bacterium]MCB9827558.1 nucleoside monophosphate kinase [Candidatus Nomurabacteria bacterium]